MSNKPILFIAHGMGKHNQTWSKEPVSILNDALSYYPAIKFTSPTLARKFEIIPLTYDGFFEKRRKQWTDDTKKLVGIMQKDDGKSEAMSKLEADKLIKIQASTTKDSFFNTHILDILLYRFTDVGEQIRVNLAKTIATSLFAGTKPRAFHILAHSMGTSVVHDTLHKMYSSKPWRDKSKVNKLFTPRNIRATSLTMLSNVTRALQSFVSAYESRVRPGPSGVCDTFLNINHMYDPVSRVMPFEPDGEWQFNGKYQEIRPRLITEPNVHAMEHYLANPVVHVPLFQQWFESDRLISAKQMKEALDAYRETTLNESLKELEDELVAVAKEPDVESLQSTLEAWNNFSKLLDSWEVIE